ncbi:hypothetical protein LCGC14_2695270 [marine sediment metagenome]|uniref:Uncharacterized protein n=1 Tax=marine sediment metagenome TaxID=412755 RepID=A0A0F8ZHA1_9ZZZZ
MGANTVAELMVETQLPIMMIVTDTAIPKGTVLKLTTPFTVAASSANEDPFGGIAAEEKISGDGKLQIAVYRDGIFKCEAGAGGVTVGLPVGIIALNNFTDTAAGDNEKGANFGTALETAADTQFFLMELGRQG